MGLLSLIVLLPLAGFVLNGLAGKRRAAANRWMMKPLTRCIRTCAGHM